MDEKKIQELDDQIVSHSKKISVLKAISWPVNSEVEFLEGWRKGNAKLPEVQFQRQNLNEEISKLDAVVAKCSQDNPIEKFLAETAGSYADAGRMLNHVGSPDFTRYSCRIYGRPDAVYKSQGISAVDGARFFLEVTDKLIGTHLLPSVPASIPANEFAAWLKGKVDKFFDKDEVKVIIDPDMTSKALAGAKRIRVRESALFSQLDKDQLLNHEAFVHTATQLNGKKQSNLKSLGLVAPRTTRTQEGIAVLAETITNSIDINRLRRIALRVIAVDMGMKGADFLEVFRFFLDAGQSELESVLSAQRIFRGGDVKGGVVFTKDSVYLEGLFEVHTFLRLAIRDNRPHLVSNLFAGRLTLADALRMEPFFISGWLKPPAYMPVWASDLNRLAALLAYSAFTAQIKLENVYLERAIEFEDELKQNA
jgi:uncharacterized protein (TIGR02421 family)